MTLRRIGRIGLLAIVVGIVALGVGGYFVVAPKVTGMDDTGHASPETAEAAMASPGLMYSIKERVVNLADPGGRRYLKVSMYVEFSIHAAELRRASAEVRKSKQAEFDKTIAPQAPLIEDAIITLLASKTSTDISSPEGRLQLKNETITRLNQVLGGEQVTNVYFTQFLTQ